jgi:ribulose-phosphate 3-epimerase
MKTVAPAILTDDPETFKKMVSTMGAFADVIQVDVMDGKLVPSSSIGPETVASCRTGTFAEGHLMVEDPYPWIDAFAVFGAKRILVHYEMKNKDFERVFAYIREKGMSVGLVVNPDTEIAEFEDLLPRVDILLFMSVYPGFYGASFVPKVVDKIKAFKQRFPSVKTAIDGGVNKANIKELAALGLDILCVGSAIGKAADPKAAWLELKALVA